MATQFDKYATREEWLKAAEAIMATWIEIEGYEYPTNTRVACGFPKQSKGRGVAIGQCWSTEVSGDKHFEIFVSPTHANAVEACGTLLHEMVHATVGIEAGHGKEFVKLARLVGLEGKATHCGPGADTKELIELRVLKSLGAYPAAQMNILDIKTKKVPNGKTYLRKCECEECGYIAYTTAKWITEVGLPHCPDHGEMEDKGK